MPSQENKIISIENLWLSYTDKSVLEDINLDIYQGDFLLVSGRTAGKDLAAAHHTGLAEAYAGAIYFFEKGEPVDSLDIGYLPQKNSIDSKFPITVEEVVASGLMGKSAKRPQSVLKREIDYMLDLMGITALRESPSGYSRADNCNALFSAGRVISHPEMLILDEPSSYIDRQFEVRMVDILRELSSRGTTIMMVSHEIEPFIALSNRNLYIDHTLGDR